MLAPEPVFFWDPAVSDTPYVYHATGQSPTAGSLLQPEAQYLLGVVEQLVEQP